MNVGDDRYFFSRKSCHSLVRPLQEYYIIAPGHIYQSPDAASVISHRLVNIRLI
jgi:hypothetical protein